MATPNPRPTPIDELADRVTRKRALWDAFFHEQLGTVDAERLIEAYLTLEDRVAEQAQRLAAVSAPAPTGTVLDETTPTTAEQREPTVQWAQTLLHHASHPDPISMHCAIPARAVEDAARHLALVEQRLAGARATIARLEGENANARESLRAIAAGVNSAFHECAVLVVEEDLVDGIPPQVVREVNTLVEMLLAERTRADAAERRVDDMTPLARLGEWALERIRGVYAGDVDAFDVQEKATTFGVIAPQTAPKPCGECCVCEEMDADVCYRDTDATTRARAALAAASGDTATTEGGT